MKSPNVTYLDGLDHLRAVAALLIIHYHGMLFLDAGHPPAEVLTGLRTGNPFLALVFEGHTAVTLFMVLSGFVFSVSSAGKDIQYLPYLRNRFLRIYPLFLLLTFTGLAAFPAKYSFLGLLQTLFFQGNYVGGVDIVPFSGIYWAVAVEFQFYLIFPFLHRILDREGWKWAALAVLFVNVLRVLAFMISTTNARDIVYGQMPGRLDQFLIGMVAARVHLHLLPKKLPWGLLTLGALALVFAVLFGFHELGGYVSTAAWKLHWPTVEALTWATFTIAYVRFSDRMPRFLSVPLAAIGTISYSTYLLHLVAIQMAARYVPPFQFENRPFASLAYTSVVVLPLLLLAATLSYHVVERPFLALRTKYIVDRTPPPPPEPV